MYKKFVIKNILIVLSIVSIIPLFNYIVDPFNFNKVFELELNKLEISYKNNYRLYKMQEFKDNPKSFILLGDSRSDALKEHFFKELSVENFYNFSYGGGTLIEAIDSFWFAIRQTKLEKVIFGIPFNIFNEQNSMNLTSQAEYLIHNPMKYYMNYNIAEISLLNLKDKYIAKQNLEKPPMDKEAFWKHQLEVSTENFYSKYRYKYPVELLKKLEEIANYCNKNDIELIFYIPPTHIDLQNEVKKYNLEKEYENYKKFLISLATTVDFDYENEITINKENYTDPYHFNQAIAKMIVQDLITKTTKISKRHNK